MKKATSFLLTLVMLMSMLPGVALPAAAAESTGKLDAYYTYGAVKVDGKLDDGRWLLTEKIGSTPAALLCDQENLYLALQTGADSAEVTLNGVTAKVDLAAFYSTIFTENRYKFRILQGNSTINNMYHILLQATISTIRISWNTHIILFNKNIINFYICIRNSTKSIRSKNKSCTVAINFAIKLCKAPLLSKG